MDPLAHTLVGASLSETRLKHLSALATPTLIAGANLPDVDTVTMLFNRNLSLGFRRGWTHGILAMVVLPLALTGVMLLIDRILARRRGQPPRARAAPLAALAYIAVLTHPALDWLNTYGIRLLMPFDGRWFYGDALFIIDPWIWLLAATVVVLAHTRSGTSMTIWLILGIVLTAVVTGFAVVPPTARLIWVVGVGMIVSLRVYGGVQDSLTRIATICLTAVLLYTLAMVGASMIAKKQVAQWLTERGSTPVEIMAEPIPANPFVRNIVVVDDQHYHFVEVNWLNEELISIAGPSIDRGPHGPVVKAALMAPHAQGLKTWMRFPAYAVVESRDGYRVSISDIRFSRSLGTGFGTVVVELDRNLQLRDIYTNQERANRKE